MFVSNPISLGEEKRIAFVAGNVAGSLPPYAEMEFRRHFRLTSETSRAFVVANSKMRLVTLRHVVIYLTEESSPNDVNKMAGN